MYNPTAVPEINMHISMFSIPLVIFIANVKAIVVYCV